jgi:hypothetical protein
MVCLLAWIDPTSLLGGGVPPKQTYETLPLAVQLLSDAVGKVFPAAPGVTVGLFSTADGQHRVAEKDVLSRPVLLPGRFSANICRGLTENILQQGRSFRAFANQKC